MVNFGEKAKAKEAGNLNSGRSYVITTVNKVETKVKTELAGVSDLSSINFQRMPRLSFPRLSGFLGKLDIFVIKLARDTIILLTSSKNQIYEFRIPNIYNYFFNNIQLMYTLCFLVASVKLKVYKKVVKFSFKQQKILGIRNS